MRFKSVRTAMYAALAAATIAACAASTATRSAHTRSSSSGLSLAAPTTAEGRPREIQTLTSIWSTEEH